MKKFLLGALALLGFATQAVAAPFVEGQAYRLKLNASDLYFNMEIDGIGDNWGRHCASLQELSNATTVYFVQNPENESQWQIRANSADGPNLSSNSYWNSIINSTDGYYWTVTEYGDDIVTFARTQHATSGTDNTLGPNVNEKSNVGAGLWSNQNIADANKLEACKFKVIALTVPQYSVTLTVNYGVGKSFVKVLGKVDGGETYTVPAYDPSVIMTVTGWTNGETVNADINLVATLAEGVKPFKFNNLRYLTGWATTSDNGLAAQAQSYDAGEYFFEVPTTNGNFKIYSLERAKWVGSAGNNINPIPFNDETPGEFQVLKHASGAEAVGRAGIASGTQGFLNWRSASSIGTWSAGNDAGSHWFMVYDNTNYQANLTAAGITIGGAYGDIQANSAYETAIASAEAKYEKVKDLADDVAEGFGAQKTALKNAIDAVKAARLGGEGVNLAELLATLAAANEAVNPNIVSYSNGVLALANGDAFAELGIATEAGVAAWNEVAATAKAVAPNEFTEEVYNTVIEAYTALVNTSAQTAGNAYVIIKAFQNKNDLMCMRYNNANSPYVGRYGSDVNGNKTTWKIVATEGGFKLYNAYAAKYLKMTQQDNQNATAVDEAEATVFVLDLHNALTGQYGIKCVTPTPAANREYLHSNNGNTIVRWQKGDNSSWYLAKSNAETAAAEAAIGEEERSTLVKAYTSDASFWTAASVYPAGLATGNGASTHVGANGHTVYVSYVPVTTKGVAFAASFAYSGGDHRIDMLGADVVDANGHVVASDYHTGYVGNQQSGNTYNFAALPEGNYIVRLFVCHAPNNGHSLNLTNGSVRITKVTELTDVDAAAAMYTTLKAAAQTEYIAYKGEGIGYYNTEAIEAAMEATAAEETVAAYTAVFVALDNTMDATSIQTPVAGKFYRIKNNSGNGYLNSGTGTGRTQFVSAELTEATQASTIFYYTGSKLVSYSNGLYISDNGAAKPFLHYTNTLGEAAGRAVNFVKSPTPGKVNITFANNRYFYSAGVNNTDAGGDVANPNGNYQFTIEEVTELPVAIAANTLSGTVYSPVELGLNGLVKAFVGTLNDEKTELTVTEVEAVPANTGVIVTLTGTEAPASGYVFLPTQETTITDAVSDMTGAFETIAIASTETSKQCIYNSYDEEINGEPVAESNFVWAEGNAANIKGFTAYVVSSEAEEVTIVGADGEGNPTGIEEVETTAPVQQGIYDLQGRRLSAPVKGINIINGKKVLVK